MELFVTYAYTLLVEYGIFIHLRHLNPKTYFNTFQLPFTRVASAGDAGR